MIRGVRGGRVTWWHFLPPYPIRAGEPCRETIETFAHRAPLFAVDPGAEHRVDRDGDDRSRVAYGPVDRVRPPLRSDSERDPLVTVVIAHALPPESDAEKSLKLRYKRCVEGVNRQRG
jgi:hypothetical protein